MWWTLLLVVVAQLWPSASPTPWVEVTCGSPVVLDAPLTFNATLHQPEGNSGGPFVFKWVDDASPAHWREQEVDWQTATLQLTYPSGLYEAGSYSMEVSVYGLSGIFRELIAKGKQKFQLTEQLNGEMLINGNVVRADHGEDLSLLSVNEYVRVSTKNTTVAEVRLVDPTHFLDNATMEYFWFVNETNYGISRNANFSFEFTTRSFSKLEVTVIAAFANDTESSKMLVSQNDLPSNPSAPSHTPGKKAVFRTAVVAVNPTDKLEVSGETWIKHGDMVDLSVTCDGTGPWTVCWDHVPPNYNVTGNETCGDVTMLEDSCQFPVLWYFRQPDSYGFLLQASNGVGKKAEVVTVNVYEVHKQTSLSFVLAPVISSVAIIVIAAAAYIFYRHYSSNSSIETADFDFTLHDEDDPDLEDRTFFERLRDSMMNVFSSTNDSLSHVSSTASSVNGRHHHGRSGHGSAHHGEASASANIHYGSIT